MKSIFHLSMPESFLPGAEALRTELTRWLELEIDKSAKAGLVARLVRDRQSAKSEIMALTRTLNFWREIVLDKEKDQ